MALAYPKTINLFSEAEIRQSLRRDGYLSFAGKRKIKRTKTISPLVKLLKKGYIVYDVSRDANNKSFILLEGPPAGHISLLVILYP